MNTSMPSPRGQALILIALAVVGLVAFAALAIDGSAVFSDRRHSQNASDTAAFAAALSLARDPASNWQQAGKDRAASNGYTESDGVTKVYVHLCNTSLVTDEGITLTCEGLPAGANPAEYVHVYIKSVVRLYFARVIGWGQVVNHTDAVVRASLPKVTPWYDGNALVSTMTTCPPTGYPHDPFTVTGSSGTTVVSSGILVNSECTFPDAYDQGGSSQVKTDKGVCVVGDAESTNTVPAPVEDCSPIDPNQFVLPEDPACTKEGKITEIAPKVYVASAGNYDEPFPKTAGPAGALTLEPGVYCFNDGIDLQSSWNITTDLNGNGQHDGASEGVFFYVPHGDVTFNGNSYLNIHAVSEPFTGFNSMYLNYFMYVPTTNDAVIKITGSDGSKFTGTILAPSSHIALSGGSTTSGGLDDGNVTLDAQIIGYSIAIAGNGTLDILYTQSNNAITTTKPTLAQTE